MEDEYRHDDGADRVREPERREKDSEKNRDKHRDGTVGVTPVMPSVGLHRLAADGATLGTRVAEKNLFHDDGNRRHDGRNPLGVRLFAVNERTHRIVAKPDTHRTHGKPDAHRDERLESPMPVRVLLVGRQVPELGTDDNRDVGNKVRCAVDSVGH